MRTFEKIVRPLTKMRQELKSLEDHSRIQVEDYESKAHQERIVAEQSAKMVDKLDNLFG